MIELYENHLQKYPQQMLRSSTFTTVLRQLIELSVSVTPDEKRKDLICDVLHYKINQQILRKEMTTEEGQQLHLLICMQIDEYYDVHHSLCCVLS